MADWWPQRSQYPRSLFACAVALCLSAFAPAETGPAQDIETLRASLNELRTGREALLQRVDALLSKTPAAAPRKPERAITDADRAFWSFQPLLRGAPPSVVDSSWAKTPVDRFILSRLEEKKLAPSAPASPRALIRRLYFDVIGLPPTPEEADAFERDPSPVAYEQLVNRLLASPQYGERWGRHWLDVARYADSDGYEFDLERPTAYHYRDFVIKALNEDLPFDTFVKWQLAGDELAPDNPLALAATGFCTNGTTVSNQVLEQNRYDELDDILSTTSQAFLGMTVACARCHDHKYDPLPARDYYRMLSAFTTSKRTDAMLAPRAEIDAYRAKLAEWEKRSNAARADVEAIYGPVRAKLRTAKIDALQADDSDKKLLKAKADPADEKQKKALEKYAAQIAVSDDEIRKSLDNDMLKKADAALAAVTEVDIDKPNAPPLGLTLTDAQPTPMDSYFLARGNPDAKQEKVSLGFLRVLPGDGDERFSPTKLRPEKAPTTFQRAALAAWLTDVEHGAGRLTARVIVNRLWHHHFGQGIVRTPNDFGTQGDRPSHPELLDWLATQLVDNGWSLKYVHKLILLSATYQESSTYNDQAVALDPENRLLWRHSPQRLEAEIVRDGTLAVTGTLNTRMYGPGVYPFMPPDAVATGSTPKWPKEAKDGPDSWRRSVYIFVRRSARLPMIEAFDAPDTVASCGRRIATVTPTQSLSLMNSAFTSDQAKIFAERIHREAGEDQATWVDRAYQLALNRAPSEKERTLAMDFLRKQVQRHARQENAAAAANYYALHDKDLWQSALTDFAQVVLSLNEFVYVD